MDWHQSDAVNAHIEPQKEDSIEQLQTNALSKGEHNALSSTMRHAKDVLKGDDVPTVHDEVAGEGVA